MSFHCSAEAGSSRSTPSEDVRNIKNYCKQKTPKAFSGSICGPMEWELKAADGASLHQNQEIYPCTHTLWTLTWIKARVWMELGCIFFKYFPSRSVFLPQQSLQSLGQMRIETLSLLENQIKPKQPPFANTSCLPPALFSSDWSFVYSGYWLCLYCRLCTQSAVCCGGGRRNHCPVQPPLGEWCQQPLSQCMSIVHLCLHWFFT